MDSLEKEVVQCKQKSRSLTQQIAQKEAELRKLEAPEHVATQEKPTPASPIKQFNFPEGFSWGKCLGSGAFGSVHQGSWLGESVVLDQSDQTKRRTILGLAVQSVAIKVLPEESSNEAVSDFVAEIQTHAAIPSHPNIVSFLGECLKPSVGGESVRGLVMEYCNRGSLKGFMDSDTWKNLTPEKKTKLYLEIAQGMRHLSKMGFLHRDLAARNIFIHEHPPENFTVKIGDFGLSKKGKMYTPHPNSYEPSPIRWMAPESLKNPHFDEKTEVWMFAATMIELLSGKPPFPNLSHLEASLQVFQGRIPLDALPPEVANALKPEFSSLMSRCFSMNPSERPTFADICAVMEQEGFIAADNVSITSSQEDIPRSNYV